MSAQLYREIHRNWDTLTDYTKECFIENEIPYKYEKGKLYIPEDAFDTAIYTCS
ncbi:hypothetical protein BsBEST3102_35600 [Bacillus subtilis]|nr:hypothetical protein BsBEST3102_35600 [Bacillus subtilis]BDB94772.1 hypothetical protein BSG8_35240 [Bacillus subtilis subsp. natto]BCV85232.1 hypothetical protein BsBEST3106_35600 [Bacillus subtilis]BCV89465.1 hypothetical protein BsBEST3109_35610 [Bacillus subtilis]BCV93694.1 hypothetical protein BsBEST3125_35570 [Bacillus subtilis]